MTNSEPLRIYRKDYKQAPFTIDDVHLDVAIYPEYTRVVSTLSVRRCTPGSSDDLVLDGEDLDTKAVYVDDVELNSDAYAIENSSLRLSNLPDKATVRTEVVLKPHENFELSGFYQSGSTLCTQCEAEGFRRITWFLDRPDILSRYTIDLSADAKTYPVLLGNGNLLAESVDADGRKHVTWQDPHPKPCYLFAMVAGDLDVVAGPFTTASGREVHCEVYVEPGRADRAHWALESLHNSMRWDEETYGLEYDLDRYMIVAVSTFNMGAMENKGLNIFNDKYVLASNDTATDSDFEGVEGVIGHEYFHNWTGNRVTCRDWFQLTLKEGLTVFRDQQFSADRTSHAVKRIDEVAILRGHQFPEDAGPMSHPIRPESYIAMDNFYTSTVYNKGAEVIRMYHTLLGADGFRAGMDLYFKRHDGQAVTCDDFRAAMADANGRDLTQFERWYTQPGTPGLTISTAYDATTQSYTIRAQQDLPQVSGYDQPEAFHLPIRMGLLNAVGQALPLSMDDGQSPHERVLECTDIEQSWTFTGIDAEPIPSLLRDFSAPVRLHYDASFEQLVLLASADSDPFNRWQAGQEVARRVLITQIEAFAHGEKPQASSYLEQVFETTLQDHTVDGALRALALGLPNAKELAQEFTPVPVEAIQEVRAFHKRHLAQRFADTLQVCYDNLSTVDPSDRSILARQQRRLRHACLGYLVELGDGYIDLAAQHYAKSGNMTERVAALSLLAHHPGPQRESAFADFYKRFEGDDLVIDKWFALQAYADCPDTIERVSALRDHVDFTYQNPNRVRSLLSALAIGNHFHFHRADGAGYQLIGDAVVTLADKNPQLAARMVSTLNQWKRYDSSRQALMGSQLERIKAINPSRDVLEIVDKALS